MKGRVSESDDEIYGTVEDEGEKGFLDFIADIEENSTKMTEEISIMGNEMSTSISAATSEINRVKAQSGSVDASFVRNICRKLSNPVNTFAGNLKVHVSEVSRYWSVVENSYLSLLNNQYAKNIENLGELKASVSVLKGMQGAIYDSDGKIEEFIVALRGSMGMESRLNTAISLLVSELEEYLLMTQTIASSIDRIISKGEIVVAVLETE